MGKASESGSSSGAVVIWRKGDGLVVLVLYLFFLLWSKCPLAVATVWGGYFCSAALVSPGIFGRKPFSWAVFKQLIVGEPRVAWACARCSAGVALCPVAMLFNWAVKKSGWLLYGSRCHRKLVDLLWLPVRITLPVLS